MLWPVATDVGEPFTALLVLASSTATAVPPQGQLWHLARLVAEVEDASIRVARELPWGRPAAGN